VKGKKMNKVKIMSLSVIALFVAGVIGFTALSRVSAMTDEPNKTSMMKEKHEKMHECTASCVKDCHASMEDIASAKAAIKAAMDALDKDDKATAKSELEKADKLLTKAHKCMKDNIDKMPCVNGKCPISGKEFDKMDVPADHTRMYKGMKIGFCCSNCPIAWDKLTDEEKDAKLKEIMPPK
jgi:hypothetical protein